MKIILDSGCVNVPNWLYEIIKFEFVNANKTRIDRGASEISTADFTSLFDWGRTRLDSKFWIKLSWMSQPEIDGIEQTQEIKIKYPELYIDESIELFLSKI